MGEHIIPERFRVLSGSVLKALAVASMLVDHVATILPTDIARVVLFSVPGRSVMLYTAMRSIGRIAFPIFCFLLVEGFHHTHGRRAYGIRLATFALVSEAPWNLWHNGTLLFPSKQNVFFTLLLSYVVLCLLERCERSDGVGERRRFLAALAGLCLVMYVTHIDYGVKGLACVLAIYLLRELPVPRAIVASVCDGSPLFASLAFVPIGMYNGERGFIRGRVLQLLFYAIYPAHMLLLWWIKYHVLV